LIYFKGNEKKISRKWLILFGTGMSGITVGLDLTIVNASLTNIQSSINASITELQWIMSGFGLLFCAFLVTMGRLGDIHGQKKILITSLIGFALASLGAGLSFTPITLILMRMLQGICGAAILPCGTALTANSFPKEEQGRALGIYGSLIGIGIGLGPFIGGILNEMYGWPSIFFINVPIVILSLILCIPLLKESNLTKGNTVDWIGSILLILGLGSLMFSLSQGQYYGWISIPTIASLLVSMIAFMLFYSCEKRTPNPILPAYLFNNPGFQLATLIYAGSVAFHWPVLFLSPIYLQKIVEYKIHTAGIILASMTLMTIISPLIAGYWFDKKSKKLICHIIFLLNSISLLMFIFFRINGPIILILSSFILYGLAWGIGNGIATPIALAKLKNHQDAGVASGALTTVLNVFAVLSLTISIAIFNFAERFSFVTNTQKLGLVSQLKNIDLNNNSMIDEIRNNNLYSISEKIMAIYKEAFMHGMQTSYIWILGSTLICWYVASKLIKKAFHK
jgi:EmrB/QacA subfamily drug resistance transporter